MADLTRTLFRMDFDPEADLFYISFRHPQPATETGITEDGILLRFRDDELVGFTTMLKKNWFFRFFRYTIPPLSYPFSLTPYNTIIGGLAQARPWPQSNGLWGGFCQVSDNYILPLQETRILLLVDDDPLILTLGRELLEHLGFEVLSASHGDEAVELFRRRHQDIAIVICDFYLPRIDGYELLHQLQTISPEVKVIVASGFFSQVEINRFQEAGVAGMIDKPFRVSQLQREISRILGE